MEERGVMNRGSYAGAGGGGNLWAGEGFRRLLGASAGDIGTDGTAENGKEYEHQAGTHGAHRNKEHEALRRFKVLHDSEDRLLQLRVRVLNHSVHVGKGRLSQFLPFVREQNLYCGESRDEEKSKQA